MDAARAQFHTHGLDKASLDAIAADAGVSKMTVYSHFKSKNGLFEAVVRDRSEQVMPGRTDINALDPRQPEQALLTIGQNFLALAREDHALAQFRALYGAAATQHEACRAFYRQGADRLISDLADYLGRASLARALTVPNPRLAADLFLAMFLGDGHIRGLLKLPMPTPAQDHAMLQEAVRVFLAGYQARC
ncbi:TetR/AcrR family transcriptional regulator [uncultured Aquincola sp.]|uniref:TetR/AcrR family transcriptional regulator n=1 Tax=uncultured Aquincola sp. TaxID=886556 RepID=UPI0032B20209